MRAEQHEGKSKRSSETVVEAGSPPVDRDPTLSLSWATPA